MLDRLKSIFSGDGKFIPSTSVFPEINAQGIAKKLNLEKRAKQNANRGLPETKSTTLDSVEMEIVGEIGEARRQGIQNYQINMDVYSERLARATDARKEVDSVAGKTKGDFRREVLALESVLANPVEKVRQWYEFVQSFREEHRLKRPAEERSPVIRWIALIVVILLVESALNGYLFAQKNELGLLGGAMAAILISLANVGLSSVLGYYSRFINSAKFLPKLWGLVLVLAWVVLISAFNLAVAHFRDAVQTIGDWSLAATTATNTLLNQTLNIASIESWLLIVLGGLISLLAFMKAYYADDPYPSYGKYARSLSSARNEYTDELDDALGQLEMRRDDAIEELKEADQFVNRELSEAVDALSGQSSLQSHLANFLEQCDHTARQLLKQYRDSNRAERKTDAPDYFDESFAFDDFSDLQQDIPNRQNALSEQVRVAELVDRACKDIHQEYLHSLKKFESIRGLQDGVQTGPNGTSGHRQSSGVE